MANIRKGKGLTAIRHGLLLSTILGASLLITNVGEGNAANTIAPSISGTRGGTLTSDNGTWTGASSLAGEWYADGVATGNTTTSYSDADTSQSIEYRVTAQPGGVVASAYDGALVAFSGYLEDFDSYADGTNLAAQYQTGNSSTFAATPTPHIAGWSILGYSNGGASQSDLQIWGGKVKQQTQGNVSQGAVARDFGSASGLFEWTVLFALTPGTVERRLFSFSIGSNTNQFSTVTAIDCQILSNGFGAYTLSLTANGIGTVANLTLDSLATTNKFAVKLDATAKKAWLYQDGALIGSSSGYDLSAWAGPWTTNHGVRMAQSTNSPAAGAILYDELTFQALDALTLTASVNAQSSGSPGQYQVDISANVVMAGATGAEYKIETEAGQFVQGWTALTLVSGTATGSFIIPDFAYEGQKLRAIVRNIGGTVQYADALTADVPYALQQSMRIAVNEAPLTYGEGQVGARDVFMPLSFGPGYYLTPTNGSSYHDFGTLAIGDSLDNYGNWALDYDPAQLYPSTNGAEDHAVCVLNGVQWVRTGTTARSGVAPDPTDPDGTVSGWKRGRYAMGSVCGVQANGWPSKLPDDPFLTITFPLPTYFQAGVSYPVTIHCKTEPGVKFISSGTAINPVSNVDLVAGTFDLVVTGDGTHSIHIDRSTSGPISSAFFLSGVPTDETGTPEVDVGAPYVSAIKKSDLTPFYGYRRLTSAPIERFGGSPEFNFTAANVEADGSRPDWKYECDVANQMGGKVIKVAVPDNADDDWITAQATFFLAHLNSDIQVRPTYSNEIWSDGSYKNAADNDVRAAAAGISPVQYYARQINRVAAIWKSVWTGANASRVKPAFEWQSVASTSAFAEGLDFENCYQNVGVVSIAPYFGGGIGSAGLVGSYSTATTDMRNAVTANDQAAFNAATDTLERTAVADAVSALKAIYAWLPTYSVSKGLAKDALEMEAYEGGQHIVVDEAGWDTGLGAGMGARAAAMFASYKRSATFAATMALYLDTIATECPVTLFFYNYMGFITTSGWGMMDREGETTQEPYVTIKSKALVYNT